MPNTISLAAKAAHLALSPTPSFSARCLAPGGGPGFLAIVCTASPPLARLLAPLLHTVVAVGVAVIGYGFLRQGGVVMHHPVRHGS